jgi:hypothetical protein
VNGENRGILTCGRPTDHPIIRFARNLAYQAAVAGYSVLFVTAAELLDDLRSEVAQTTFRRKLAKYASPQLLVIDEVGYKLLTPLATDPKPAVRAAAEETLAKLEPLRKLEEELMSR